jgi:hypothetical protein
MVNYILINIFNLRCLRPVACVRSGDGGFLYPSTQRHYPKIILLLILLSVSVVRPSSSRNVVNYILKTILIWGCLHPVACQRSGDWGFYIRLRNVTVLG